VRSNITNLYSALLAVLMFAEVVPLVGWKVASHTKQRILLQQTLAMSLIYFLVVGVLSVVNVFKGVVFFLFILSQKTDSPFLSNFMTTSTEVAASLAGADRTARVNQVLFNAKREGAFTLIAETVLILLVVTTIQKYRPLVISAKDAVYYRRQMVASLHQHFWMSFVSPVFEIAVYLVTAIWMNFFGFVLAFFCCLVSFCQIPSFDRNYSFKVLTYSIFNVVCWLVVISILLMSSSNMFSYFGDELSMKNTKVKYDMGGYLAYEEHPSLKCRFINVSDQNSDYLFAFFILLFAFASSFILYHLRMGSLCESYFEVEMAASAELPPQTTFKDTKPWLDARIDQSYYIKYFLKKVSLMFKINYKKSIDPNDELSISFLKTVPYLDTKAITKKLRIYKRWKEKGLEEEVSLSKKIIKWFIEFLIETTVNVITISNIVYCSLFGYVAFFFYFKNDNPSFFSFLPFVGIFLLGIKSFKTFIFYSQFLVGMPLIINLMLFYFSNLRLDIGKCKGSSNFYCQPWFGFIRKVDIPGYSTTALLKETLVKIFLFQGIFFFYRMLKFTDELFVEKSTHQLNLEIEESFNRDSLPFIRILLIQISSKFYIVCLLLMLYIGTSKVSYTNMVLLIVAVIYSTKFKLIRKYWIIIYVIMNLIFLTAYFIDLSISSSDVVKAFFSKDILELLGLPVNTSETADLFQKGASKTSNKILVMFLYICCLIQQIAGKNKYIKCYLLKLDRIKSLKKDTNMLLIASVNTWKQRIKVFTVKVYYKAGVWIAYGLNLYLPLVQSISFSRAVMLCMIVATFIVHINALRVATVGGRVYLDKTYVLWKIFLAIKVINIAMLIVGVFGVTTLVREKLNLIKDSSDYLVTNYIGVESMEPQIITSISTLQNCENTTYIQSNRLRTYFVIEMLTFIFTKIAMKIIQIQRLYNNNLVGFVTSEEIFFQLKSQKPRLFRVYKIYHKYIVGSQFMASKAGNRIFSNISSFLARIYTSLIYVITLSISVFTNISLLMFVSLYYFLNYFIRMNKIFLQYLTTQNVEKVLDIKFKFFKEKYISSEALSHIDGQVAVRLNNQIEEDDPGLGQTNEEVRQNVNVNLWTMALKLRLEITRYDKENKYRLFLVSLIVTSSIIILTYFNALTQHILKTGKTVNYLVIFSTIWGFKYEKTYVDAGAVKSSCIGNALLPFIGLFLLLAYDVYVIRVITALEKDIIEQLDDIEKKDLELRHKKADNEENDYFREQEVVRRSIFQPRKNSDESDSEDDKHKEDFSDLTKFEIGADENEKKLEMKALDELNIAEDKELELFLLDEQDRQEIRIKALRAGGEVDLKKYSGYDSLKELDLHPWNFYEFYEVEKKKDNQDFTKFLREMRRNKKKIIDSDSESEDSHENGNEGDNNPLAENENVNQIKIGSKSRYEEKLQHSSVLSSKRKEI
jgi:hypothetical protein